MGRPGLLRSQADSRAHAPASG
ncbi:hypothetical protein M5D98_31015 [Mesorhizobium opportunistum]|nr:MULTISPECIES: hypothetical protein [Mesorhizobium]UQS68184.1 hypothetical protein M5D98_31015 [Mesorhizobium opportunistum]